VNNIHQDIAERGLTVVVGCTKSGKSDHLLVLESRLKIKGLEIVFVKPGHSGRRGTVAWRSGGKTERIISFAKVLEVVDPIKDEIDVVMFDDAHFLDSGLLECVDILVRRGKSVVVAGLNLDCNGEHIGDIRDLSMLADAHHPLYGVCHVCGNVEAKATRSQRMKNGKAIGAGDIFVVPEGQLFPVCREHFVKPTFESSLVRIKGGKGKKDVLACKKCAYEFPIGLKPAKCPDCGSRFINKGNV